MKKIITTLTALALCLALTTPTVLAVNPWAGNVTLEWTNRTQGLNNFRKVRTYAPGTYADVPAGAWYEEHIKTLYELGLIAEGRKFRLEGNMTLAQVVSLAVQIHSTYQNWVIPSDQSDLDYALAVGIVAPGQYDNYSDLATRRSFAAIMRNALPIEALPGINVVMDNIIPDVRIGEPGAQAIYELYRAGVLLGGNSRGAFCPNELITRGAAAVAAARMVSPSLRQGISLFAAEAAGIILSQPTMVLSVGESGYLTAMVVPENTHNKTVVWSSSKPEVASVDAGGRVTALSEGTAIITASTYNGGVSATCAVGVGTAPLTVSDTGFYPDWPLVPDFGAMTKMAPVRMERHDTFTAYYYLASRIKARDVEVYGEKLLSAGFLLDETFENVNGYSQQIFRKLGDGLRAQTVAYGQEGGYFVVRPGRDSAS